MAERNIGSQAEPGEIVSVSGSEGLCVATGQGILRIEELQAEGRKAMSASDFLKGTPLKTGERLK
jgi:methionyl-tRNA formyltransferase